MSHVPYGEIDGHIAIPTGYPQEGCTRRAALCWLFKVYAAFSHRVIP
jgi:hypothetical protein